MVCILEFCDVLSFSSCFLFVFKFKFLFFFSSPVIPYLVCECHAIAQCYSMFMSLHLHSRVRTYQRNTIRAPFITIIRCAPNNVMCYEVAWRIYYVFMLHIIPSRLECMACWLWNFSEIDVEMNETKFRRSNTIPTKCARSLTRLFSHTFFFYWFTVDIVCRMALRIHMKFKVNTIQR